MYENKEGVYYIDESSVNGMIRKVFGWMFLALLVTTGVVFGVYSNLQFF